MGFKVRVQAGAFLMLGFWLLSLPMGWVAAILFCTLVHEIGHLTALFCLRERIHALEIGAFGARIETGPLEPRRELLCALAGPAAGGALCLLWQIWPEAAFASLIQTVFNLLPLYPLDGGRIVGAVRKICCK